MAKECPIEGCEKKQIATRGEAGHWTRHHKNEMSYPEFKALFPASPGDDGKHPSPSITPTPALETGRTPEEVFRLVGQNLGIKEVTAKAVAFYMTQTYDLSNAQQLWEGFKECLYLTPMERRVWWKTWVARNHLVVEDETMKHVLQEPHSPTSSIGQGKPRYLVDEGTGEMVRVDPESESYEGAMTFTDARLRSRDIKEDKAKAGHPEPRYLLDEDTGQMHRVDPESEDYSEAEPFWKARARSQDIQTKQLQALRGQGRKFYVLGTQVHPVQEGEEGFNFAEASSQAQANWDREMERERQAMERERLAVPASGDNTALITSFITPLVAALTARSEHGDNGGTLVEARLREVQTRMDSQIELQKMEASHQQQRMLDALTNLGEKINQSHREPDPVEQVTRVMDLVNTLQVQMRGEPTDDMSWKRGILKTLREQLPEFISAGREVAEATKLQLAARQEETARTMGACPTCGIKIRYPTTALRVRCPSCGGEFSPQGASDRRASTAPTAHTQPPAETPLQVEEQEQADVRANTEPSGAAAVGA